MAKNKNMINAKKAKNDEFYTQLSDIEKELQYYTQHFKDKVVFCNCNDAIHSNFAHYFSYNFERLSLKELICTSYGDDAKAFIYRGDKNGNHIPDLEEWEQIELKEKGDFRSNEMIELLKKSDIVCSNCPFSLFREYVAQLITFDKKFLIIGNGNAITYKEIFPLIKDNKIWLGCTLFCGKMPFFRVPDGTDVSKGGASYINSKGELMKQVNSIAWFTNLDHNKRHQPLTLYKRYNESEYPRYDNYYAFNVDKTSDIPMDDFIEIDIPDEEYEKWKSIYGNDIEIIKENENKNT